MIKDYVQKDGFRASVLDKIANRWGYYTWREYANEDRRASTEAHAIAMTTMEATLAVAAPLIEEAALKRVLGDGDPDEVLHQVMNRLNELHMQSREESR